MLPAAKYSGFTSTVHNTRSTSPSCLQISLILHLLACLWPLSLPEYTLRAHKAALSTDRMNMFALYRTAVVQHTLRHTARQHWPRWFCWDTLLPSVSLPNMCLLLSASVKVDQNLLLDSLKDSWDE